MVNLAQHAVGNCNRSQDLRIDNREADEKGREEGKGIEPRLHTAQWRCSRSVSPTFVSRPRSSFRYQYHTLHQRNIQAGYGLSSQSAHPILSKDYRIPGFQLNEEI